LQIGNFPSPPSRHFSSTSRLFFSTHLLPPCFTAASMELGSLPTAGPLLLFLASSSPFLPRSVVLLLLSGQQQPAAPISQQPPWPRAPLLQPWRPDFSSSLPWRPPLLPLGSSFLDAPCSLSLAQQQPAPPFPPPWFPRLPAGPSPMALGAPALGSSALPSEGATFSLGASPQRDLPWPTSTFPVHSYCSLRPIFFSLPWKAAGAMPPSSRPLLLLSSPQNSSRSELAVVHGAPCNLPPWLFDGMPVGNIVLCAAAPTSRRAVGSLFCEASGQHVVMPAGGLLFLRSPVVVVIHPGETATLLVRFRIDVIFL
jgi:hypothetical protein